MAKLSAEGTEFPNTDLSFQSKRSGQSIELDLRLEMNSIQTADGDMCLLVVSTISGSERSLSIERITQRQLKRFERSALDDVTHRAGLRRAVHIFRIVVDRENQHNDRWKFFEQLLRQLDSICAGAQTNIDYDAIRTQFAHRFQAGCGVASLFAHDKVVSPVQQALESLANKKVIVNQNEPLAIISEHFCDSAVVPNVNRSNHRGRIADLSKSG